MYKNSETHTTGGERYIDEEVDTPLFWGTAQDCEFDGEDYQLGFGAHVGGKFNVDFTYGFSLIASMDNVFDVKQANGWLNVEGESDLTLSFGGVGEVDFDKGNQGNPAYTSNKVVKLKGHTLNPSRNSVMTFEPYWNLDYMLASFNDLESSGSGASAPYFDGKLSTRIKSDFGGIDVNFPPNPEDKLGTRNVQRDNNRIALDNSNVIYNSGGSGGKLAMSTFFVFGIKIGLSLFGEKRRIEIPLIDMTMNYRTLTEWKFYPSPGFAPETCLTTSVSYIPISMLLLGKTIGWDVYEGLPYIISDSSHSDNQKQRHGEDGACYPNQPSVGADKAWGYSADSNVNPDNYMDASAADSIEESKESFPCTSCLTCSESAKKGEVCCGCANMDIDLGYKDTPACASDIDTGGPWPGALSGNPVSARGESTDDGDLSSLDERAWDPNNPTAYLSAKGVAVCPNISGAGKKYKVHGAYRYPSFPEDSARVWEGIENNRWGSISRYWGNTSSSCSDWTRGLRTPMATSKRFGDTTRPNTSLKASSSPTFFTQWLDKGQIENQMTAPSDPQPKFPCQTTATWILTGRTAFPWRLDNRPRPFIHLLLAELGNISNLDRLAILKARPNRMKGSMFGGKQSTALASYADMTPEQQLLATKEMGMVFHYLNDPTVWARFCATYEALYDLFGDFDTFYATQTTGATVPSLQDEWKEFIEVVLTSLVNRSKAAFELQTIIALEGIFRFVPSMAIHGIHWVKNIGVNQPKIRIEGTCPHLDEIIADD
ncbi:hypothetical protein BKA56DRAFT_625507 [Ilyonectria sp. MPI-CAGE-AT-0026]|nr:hypothetical protein BKA56DRAFT_625507 [Ilyonectria sp. MPI-CAGE-AT-0026]